MYKLFKNKYRIESTRLRGYDYSSDGAYFVTICVKNSECVFGDVKNYIMGLNGLGCAAAMCWQNIPSHFPFVKLDEWVVMPNHVHGVVVIENDGVVKKTDKTQCRDAINRVSTNELIINKPTGGITRNHNPMGKQKLGEIMRWFKGRCTFETHKNYDKHFEWQPRFYDHIIRNESELNRIREYILYNPERWEFDRNNNKNLWM